MARLTALQLYKYLPAKNCGECGDATCMAFAMKLIEREKKASDCPKLTEDGMQKLIGVLTPPVREVKIGTGKNSIAIGGEEVMYRHELRFFNHTAMLVDISDLMDEDEINKRINFAKNFEIERIGKKLRLDGIAIRSASDDPERFRKVVSRVAGEFSGALVLCSFNPDVLGTATEIVKGRHPLLYAANKENWESVLEIAKRYNAPLAVHAPDLDGLGAIAGELSNRGFKDIVLDPGIEWGGCGLDRTLDKFVMLRKSALRGVKELGYPLMGSTVALWMDCKNGKRDDEGDDDNKMVTRDDDNKMATTYDESTVASILIDRFASLLIIHSIDSWSVLPTITLRQNVYTDPRVEPTVEAKLYEIGTPDENSPVFITTNFALTYFSVSGDIESAKISCHLIVIDTDGLGVTVAVAAEKLTASNIADSLKKHSVEERVKHHKLIIPGAVARLKGAIEDATGWEILLGPQDSSQISGFLEKNWK